MDKNFRVRWIVGVSMFVVALVGMYTFDSIPFKVLYCLFAIMSAIELFSFFKKSHTALNIALAVLEVGFLIGGAMFVIKTNIDYFWYIILGVCGYDIFAYLFGKLVGARIFKKSRPFPHISKNKTWEGTFLGLMMSVGMVAILMGVRGTFATDYYYLFCGPLALIGDLFESYLKRKFKVKDSNEIIIKKPFFEKLELIVGGSEGHGGFLDRIDSTSFAATVLLIVSFLL